MKKSLKRAASLALILAMLFTLAAPALAVEYVIVTTTTSIRSSASQSSNNIITSIAKNSILEKTGTTGSWTIVNYNGASAYILTSKVQSYSSGSGSISSGSGTGTIIVESGTSSSTNVVTTGKANIRKGPGTNYSIVTTVSMGTTLQKIGVTGTWTIIDWNDGTAYISTSLITAGSGSSGGTSSTSTNTMQATANVNVRSGPGTNYSIVGWLAQGSTITKTGTSGNWTRVTYNNQTAYISSAYLRSYSGTNTNTNTSTTSKTLLVCRVSTIIRNGPSTAYRTIGYLDPGDTIEYLGTYGSWYKVVLGTHSEAYVYASDMRVYDSSSNVTSSSGYIQALSTARVYSLADTNSTTLAYVYANEIIEKTGVVGSTWTQVRLSNGSLGYVLTSQFKAYSTSSGYYSVNQYVYSIKANAQCFSTSVASSSYLLGYLSLNEQVYALESNGTWTRIQIPGTNTIVYTLSSNLSTTWTGGGSYYSTVKITRAGGTYAYTSTGSLYSNGLLLPYNSTYEYVTTTTINGYQMYGIRYGTATVYIFTSEAVIN